MEPILVLLNPLAGTKRGGAALAQVLDVFCKADLEPIVRLTQGVGDGTRLAREYAGRVSRIICIGGDGSFNEAVTGVLQSGKQTPIGYIPAGSTNDFAVSLGISRNILQAAYDIVNGTPRRFDVGRFCDRYFTYVASFGAFTQTSYATSQSAKNALGHLAYLLGGAASIPSIHSEHVGFVTDKGERITGDYIFGAIGNSTSMGGVLTLERSLVDFHDGVFELLLVKNPMDAVELGECLRALLAHDYQSKMLELRQIRSLTIEAEAAMDWTLDGEFAAGKRDIEIEVLPSAIQLFMKP